MSVPLEGEEEAGEYLLRTCFRDFVPIFDEELEPDEVEGEDRDADQDTYFKLSIDSKDAPLPVLLRYALQLVGIESYGPGEKVAWWANFAYAGTKCSLAHEKFGLRLYLYTDNSELEAQSIGHAVVKKLRASIPTVEKLVLDAAPSILNSGRLTVINQHLTLTKAYQYFRHRALNPDHVADESRSWQPNPAVDARAYSFKSGKYQMRVNAFHDLVAAITAWLSRLEHDLVLRLAFADFDPNTDNLVDFIGSRWGAKFDRILGSHQGGSRYRERLTNVVERWRNPYAHGGFDKHHAATLYIHTPGVNSALPLGLTRVRDSPRFALHPATDVDVSEVFSLFDEMEGWLKAIDPGAAEWIDSGLDVRFDPVFRALVDTARDENNFSGLIEYFQYEQDRLDNMDF